MYISGIMEMWLHHIIFLLLKSKKIILFLFWPSLPICNMILAIIKRKQNLGVLLKLLYIQVKYLLNIKYI